MAAEGKDHSWLTGFYWTLVVMTTLGFGDITFEGDPGRAFSILVLLSGVIFLLILLPFTFIKFFFAPWMEAEARSRAPRELPPETQGHVILTSYDPVTMAFIDKLKIHKRDYVVIIEDSSRPWNYMTWGFGLPWGISMTRKPTGKCGSIMLPWSWPPTGMRSTPISLLPFGR